MSMAERKRYWLILSYRANIDGSACSQHIDDRLPFFAEKGVTPVLLTGPVGDRSTRWIHYRCGSIAPSGIRFELRHFLRKRFRKRWQFKLVESLLLLPVFPFYLLEKLLINLESEWSWFFVAAVRGYFLCRRYRPQVIYSTGGTASAHVAADMIRSLTKLPWLAETQDPLVHDHEWRRGTRVLKVYRWLERRICEHADSFIFLAQAAREHMAARTGLQECGKVIYPGSVPSFFQPGIYRKNPACHFAHFGTLGGNRNLVVFTRALQMCLQANRFDRSLVRVDVYGALDGLSARTIEEAGLQDLVTHHGMLARKEALLAMQKADCLLLVQDTVFFSSETIPSKVYEYLLSGRPILGLVHHNAELSSMLAESGNFPAAADSPEAVAEELAKIVTHFREDSFGKREHPRQWTVSSAVDRLIELGERP